jgi:hypothetical protein
MKSLHGGGKSVMRFGESVAGNSAISLPAGYRSEVKYFQKNGARS